MSRKKTKKPASSSAGSPALEVKGMESIAQEVILNVLKRCAKAKQSNDQEAFSSYLLGLAKWHLERAVRDCRTLDESEENKDAFFLKRFLTAMQAADSVSWIHGFVIYPMDGRAMREIKEAAKKSPEHERNALTIHHLRELVRDKFSPSDALIGIAAEIKIGLEAGDVDLFERLGLELERMRKQPQNYGRSVEAWIRRAWLPLALWEFSGSKEAWPTLKRAAMANQLSSVAKGIESDARQWLGFEAAWRKVKVR
jgi:hypothetical protein